MVLAWPGFPGKCLGEMGGGEVSVGSGGQGGVDGLPVECAGKVVREMICPKIFIFKTGFGVGKCVSLIILSTV